MNLLDGWDLAPGGSALRCLAFPARHGFSTRLGGVSDGSYASLNVGMNSGDAADHVRENRIRFRTACGFSGDWAAVHQVHGPDPVVVAGDGRPHREHGDAVLGATPGLAVGVYVADCTPVLLAERNGRAVAAVHAGWRGTAAGVVSAAVAALNREFGVAPGDLVAAVGPGARRCCYEVGPEVVEALAQADPGPPRDDREGWQAQGVRRPHVDIPVVVRRQLRAAGLEPENVHASGLCTMCAADLFFSYRRDGRLSGRMVAVVEAG